jgi:capsular exopolysaccharide synthesis family protein
MNTTRHDEEPDIVRFCHAVYRRLGLVTAVSALALGAMAAYAFLTAPVYRASALLGIERAGADIASWSRAEKQVSDEAYFETQVGIVASETQLRRVYEELGLAQEREFSRGLHALRRAVTVVPVPRTRLCRINVESVEPRLASSIALALARAFVKKHREDEMLAARTALGALQSSARPQDARAVAQSLPAVLNNQEVQDLKTQIYGQEAALADLRSLYTDQHPSVQAAMLRLDALRQARDREIDGILAGVKTDLSGQFRANGARIVDEPAVPSRPVRPRRELALALGLVGGPALGVLLALLLETLRPTIRTHKDLERSIGLSLLGLIPYSPRETGSKLSTVLLSDEGSPSSEAFSNLRACVGRAVGESGDPFLLVTSAGQGEGKSFVATNLAVALSRLGEKVLIVDADLRKPTQHLNLGAEGQLGLADFLSGGVTEGDVITQRTSIPNLDLVMGGASAKNPAELLHARRLANFVAWARGRYARVIVDCPAVFPVSDVLTWGSHVNRTIFVTRYGRARVPVVQTACARLRASGARIVGGVINGAKIGRTRYADKVYFERY